MIKPSFCYCFGMDNFAENLKRIADCGFEAIEIWSYDLEAQPLEVIKKALSDAGLGVAQLCPYFNFVCSTDEWYSSVELGQQYIDYAKELNSPLIRVFTGPMSHDQQVPGNKASDEQWDAAARGLKMLCIAAEPLGIKFCLEVHHGQLAEDSNTTLRLINYVDMPNLVANPQIPLMDEDPYYSLEKLKGHIGHFHTHNWSDKIGGELTLISKGIFDWEAFLKQAILGGFDGYVSLEHAKLSSPDDPWKAAEIDGPFFRELTQKLNAST